MQIQNNEGLGIIEKTLCAGAGVYGTTQILGKISPQIQNIAGKALLNAPKPSQAHADILVNSMKQAPEIVKSGLQVFFMDKGNVKEIGNKMLKASKDSITKTFGKVKGLSDYLVKANEMGIKMFAQLTSEGKNAFYLPHCNMVAAPKSNPTLILHEMGHAINANKFKFAKPIIMAMKNPLAMLGILTIPAIAVWKACGNKEEKSFVRDNAGKLTFAAFLPTIIEEAVASAHAIKNTVKCKLPKDVLKNQAKMLGMALGSYVAMGAVAGLTVAGVVKLATLYRDARKN